MHPGRVSEALYDSQTVLQLVDRELDELRDVPRQSPAALSAGVLDPAAAPAHVSELLEVLRLANTEITQVLGALRGGRHALQDVTIDKLQVSNLKIREVSSATEQATATILDGLDRAQDLIDRLDAHEDGSSDTAPLRAQVRAQLREELFSLTEPLQFQDITAQQLSHVSSLLGDVERRLIAVVDILGGVHIASQIPQPGLFAESASVHDASVRQAEADEMMAQAKADAKADAKAESTRSTTLPDAPG